MKYAPIEKFHIHPAVKDIPTLPSDSEDYQRMAVSIEAEGILDPLKCLQGPSDTLQIVDGLHRFTMARELGLKELPYRLVQSEQLIDAVCLSAVRAEWTKSALVYRLWPMFAAEACQRGGDRKSKGTQFPLITSAAIAEKLRVCEKLVDQAKKVHAIFEKKPALREVWEPKILTSGASLKFVLDGAQNGSDGQQPPKPPALTIESRLGALKNGFEQWSSMTKEDRRRTTNAFTGMVRTLPEDLQTATLETLEVAYR